MFNLIIKRYCSTKVALPFKITLTNAKNILSVHKSFLEANIVKKTLLAATPREKLIKECYFPFQTVDICKPIIASYSATYGKTKWRNETTYVINGKSIVPVTTLVPTTTDYKISDKFYSSNYSLGTEITQLYTGSQYPSNIVESALVSKELVLTTLNEKNDFVIYPVTADPLISRSKIYEILKADIKTDIRNYILKKYDCSSVNITDINLDLSISDLKLINYYVPAYVFETQVKNNLKYLIMNGNNGKIAENKIYSPAVFSVIGGFLSAFAIGVVEFSLLLSSPLGCFFLTCLGAGISGAIAKIHTKVSQPKVPKPAKVPVPLSQQKALPKPQTQMRPKRGKYD